MASQIKSHDDDDDVDDDHDDDDDDDADNDIITNKKILMIDPISTIMPGPEL